MRANDFSGTHPQSHTPPDDRSSRDAFLKAGREPIPDDPFATIQFTRHPVRENPSGIKKVATGSYKCIQEFDRFALGIFDAEVCAFEAEWQTAKSILGILMVFTS